MSKCAFVYVSMMAPVLHKTGLPADTQLQISAARAVCVHVQIVCSRRLHLYISASETKLALKTKNAFQN